MIANDFAASPALQHLGAPRPTLPADLRPTMVVRLPGPPPLPDPGWAERWFFVRTSRQVDEGARWQVDLVVSSSAPATCQVEGFTVLPHMRLAARAPGETSAIPFPAPGQVWWDVRSGGQRTVRVATVQGHLHVYCTVLTTADGDAPSGRQPRGTRLVLASLYSGYRYLRDEL